jgi:hypothetical protein
MSNKTVYTLIDQAVVVGPGHSIRLPVVTNDHTVECFYTDDNSSVTAVILDLETSFDPPEINDADAKWYRMQRHTFLAAEITAKKASFSRINIPGMRIRANLIDITGANGTTDKFTVRYVPLYIGRS